MNNLRKGRPLNIKSLYNAKKKVPLAFKCDAKLKIDLIIEAEEKGVTLSRYMANIALKRNEKIIQNEDLYTQEELDQITNELDKEIGFFEHPKLYEALKKYEGTEVSYTDEEAFLKTIIVRSIQDVFTIFINEIIIE